MRTLPIFYLLMGVVEELATTLEHHGLWMIMCIDLLWHWYVPYVPHWILNCFYMCAGLRYFKQSAAEKWEDQLWLLESQNKDFVVLHPGRNSWTVVIISIFTTCESCAWVSKESGIDKTVVPPLLLVWGWPWGSTCTSVEAQAQWSCQSFTGIQCNLHGSI